MNRISVLAMVAAIALTAGLVLVFGVADQSHLQRTVRVADAAPSNWDMEPPSTLAGTEPITTDNPTADTVDASAMEIMESRFDSSATTTTTTTETAVPQAPPTTKPSAPPTTVRPGPTTTTIPPTTTTTVAGDFRPDLANEFQAEVNSYRAANGLAPLHRDSSLDNRAQYWSKHMADNNKLSHSNLSSLLPPWSAAGENVGRGGSVSSLMNALIGSPGHRANLLGDFTHVGIGVWRAGDGTVWVTQVFTR